MDKLKGKSAIVTGATSGMGRAAAILFAQEGASVVASGRDEERGAAVVQDIRSTGDARCSWPGT
jgi:NAD(P)-dependent dehydrogenase (short-subunit alcohol dehydrogenase family)